MCFIGHRRLISRPLVDGEGIVVEPSKTRDVPLHQLAHANQSGKFRAKDDYQFGGEKSVFRMLLEKACDPEVEPSHFDGDDLDVSFALNVARLLKMRRKFDLDQTVKVPCFVSVRVETDGNGFCSSVFEPTRVGGQPLHLLAARRQKAAAFGLKVIAGLSTPMPDGRMGRARKANTRGNPEYKPVDPAAAQHRSRQQRKKQQAQKKKQGRKAKKTGRRGPNIADAMDVDGSGNEETVDERTEDEGEVVITTKPNSGRVSKSSKVAVECCQAQLIAKFRQLILRAPKSARPKSARGYTDGATVMSMTMRATVEGELHLPERARPQPLTRESLLEAKKGHYLLLNTAFQLRHHLYELRKHDYPAGHDPAAVKKMLAHGPVSLILDAVKMYKFFRVENMDREEAMEELRQRKLDRLNRRGSKASRRQSSRIRSKAYNSCQDAQSEDLGVFDVVPFLAQYEQVRICFRSHVDGQKLFPFVCTPTCWVRRRWASRASTCARATRARRRRRPCTGRPPCGSGCWPSSRAWTTRCPTRSARRSTRSSRTTSSSTTSGR